MVDSSLATDIEVYSVDGVISTIDKSITSKFDNQNILITGVYYKDGTKDYNGCYYDHLRDINNNIFIALKMPVRIRETLEDKSICVLKGFIGYKLRRNGDYETNINVYFSVDELVREEEKQLDKTIERYYELLNKKQLKADISSNIKNKLVNNKQIEVALIIGNSAIIDKDIHSALNEYDQYYKFYQYRINLKPDEIIKQLELLKNSELDFIVISRGGGAGLEIFNNLDLLEYTINYPIPIVTAIGHKEDNTYFARLSDLDCPTPTALGTFLKTVVEDYFNNLNKLRENNINLIRKDLEKQYTERLNEFLKQNKLQTDNLIKEKDNQLKKILEEKEKQIKLIIDEKNKQNIEFNKQVEEFKNELKTYKVELENNKKIQEKLIEDKNKIKEEHTKIFNKYKLFKYISISSISILLIILVLFILFI